jgi:hypothetical protein
VVKAELQYICFNSFSSIGGVWSTLASPIRFNPTLTAWKTSFALRKAGSLIMSILCSKLKWRASPNRLLFNAESLYFSPFFFLASA